MEDQAYPLLLGHASWLAGRVNMATALADGHADCDADTPQEKALLALGKMDQLIAANCSADPGAAAIMRLYAASPPEGDLRSAKALYEGLSDEQQNVVVSVINGILLKWTFFEQVQPWLVGLEPGDMQLLADGELAYAQMLGLQCLMSGASDQAIVSELAEVVESATIGKTREEQGLTPTHVQQAAACFDLVLPRGVALIDLEACNSNPERGVLELAMRDWFAQTALSSDPDKLRHLWKAVLSRAVRDNPWTPPERPLRRISTTPPADDSRRRALRVLAMVGELHKAGYQRLRIHPWLHGSGAWRCTATSADNVAPDGYSVLRGDDRVATHSSASGSLYFEKIEGSGLNARQLAERFLEAFPVLAHHAHGQDWLYAGWFVDLLGQAETADSDGFPMWGGDQWGEPDARWMPVPPPPSV